MGLDKAESSNPNLKTAHAGASIRKALQLKAFKALLKLLRLFTCVQVLFKPFYASF